MTTHRVQPFEVTLSSSEIAARAALKTILQKLRPLGLESEEASSVELVLAEILNNIIEHAYADQEATGLIKVFCTQQCDGLHFELLDRGVSMPNGQLPLGKQSELNVPFNDLPEGGFGWFMINHLAKDVEYSRSDGSNRLKLRLAVGLACQSTS